MPKMIRSCYWFEDEYDDEYEHEYHSRGHTQGSCLLSGV